MEYPSPYAYLLKRALDLCVRQAQNRGTKVNYKLVRAPLRTDEVNDARQLVKNGKVTLKSRKHESGRGYTHTYSLTKIGLVDAFYQLGLEAACATEARCQDNFMGYAIPW